MQQALAEKERRLGWDNIYSKPLDDLVKWCIEENPLERISAEDLLPEVQAGRDRYNKDVPGGSYDTCTMAQVDRWDRVLFKQQEFILGGPDGPRQKSRRAAQLSVLRDVTRVAEKGELSQTITAKSGSESTLSQYLLALPPDT